MGYGYRRGQPIQAWLYYLWCYTRGTFAYNFITYSIYIYICILKYIFIVKGHRNSIEHIISKQYKKRYCIFFSKLGQNWHAETQLWLSKMCVWTCSCFNPHVGTFGYSRTIWGPFFLEGHRLRLIRIAVDGWLSLLVANEMWMWANSPSTNRPVYVCVCMCVITTLVGNRHIGPTVLTPQVKFHFSKQAVSHWILYMYTE